MQCLAESRCLIIVLWINCQYSIFSKSNVQWLEFWLSQLCDLEQVPSFPLALVSFILNIKLIIQVYFRGQFKVKELNTKCSEDCLKFRRQSINVPDTQGVCFHLLLLSVCLLPETYPFLTSCGQVKGLSNTLSEGLRGSPVSRWWLLCFSCL